MKNLKCNICDSNDFTLINEEYVCNFCGNKISKLNVVGSDNSNEVSNSNNSSQSMNHTTIAAYFVAFAKILKIIKKFGFMIGLDSTKGNFLEWLEYIQTPRASQSKLEIPTGYIDLYEKYDCYNSIYVGELKGKNPNDVYLKTKLHLLCQVIYNNRDAEWLHYGFDGKTVKKRGYNLSIRSKDGRYNQNVHDKHLNSLNDTLKWILELSETGKTYYINRIVPKQGFLGLLKNVDTEWTFSDLNVTQTISDAKSVYKSIVDLFHETASTISSNMSQSGDAFNNLSEIVNQLILKYGMYELPSSLPVYLQMINIINKEKHSDIKHFVEHFNKNYKPTKSNISDDFVIDMINGMHIENEIGKHDEEFRLIFVQLNDIEKRL